MSLNHESASKGKSNSTHIQVYPDRKVNFISKVSHLLNEYPFILVFTIDYVSTTQLSYMRKECGDRARFLFGKNTLIRHAIQAHVRQTGNTHLMSIIPFVRGKCGLVFAKDLITVNPDYLVGLSRRVRTPRAGDIVPHDIIVPPGPTGRQPTETGFFQAMNIATRINRGQIDIVEPICVAQKGERLSVSAAFLLNRLSMKPYTSSVEPVAIFADGVIQPINLKTEDCVYGFMNGLKNVASLSFGINHPTMASVPHSIARALGNVLALDLSVSADYDSGLMNKEVVQEPFSGYLGRTNGLFGFHHLLGRVEIPVTRVNVNARILFDTMADVTITQRFSYKTKNPRINRMVVTYVFPIDHHASVYEMKAILSDGTEVIGIVKEKRKAAREFNASVREGKQAFLVSRVTNEIIQFDIGNVSKFDSVQIVVSYVTDLPMESDSIRFYIPRSIIPRYGAVNLSALGMTPSFDFNCSIHVKATGIIQHTKIISEDSELNSLIAVKPIEGDPFSTQIDFHFKWSEHFDMVNDLVVLIPRQDPEESICVFEESGRHQSRAMLLSYQPPLLNDGDDFEEGVEASDLEIIFLVDVSGSMAGNPLRCVQSCLLKFIRSLPVGCFFNLVTFESRFESLFPTSVQYNDETFQIADTAISSMYARGGTVLLQPLLEVLSSRPVTTRNQKEIFVLTDGAVGNTNQCVQCVEAHSDECRVFTFGVGGAFSRDLVEGLAEAGGGTWEGVQNPANVGSKVICSLKLACSGSKFRKNGSIEVLSRRTGEVIPFDIFPSASIPAFSRQIFLVSKGDTEWDEKDGLQIVLSWDRGDERETMRIDVERSPFDNQVEGIENDEKIDCGDEFIEQRVSTGEFVHRLVARSQLKHASREKILELGLKYNLLTSETSFIAVHRTTSGIETERSAQQFVCLKEPERPKRTFGSSWRNYGCGLPPEPEPSCESSCDSGSGPGVFGGDDSSDDSDSDSDSDCDIPRAYGHVSGISSVAPNFGSIMKPTTQPSLSVGDGSCLTLDILTSMQKFDGTFQETVLEFCDEEKVTETVKRVFGEEMLPRCIVSTLVGVALLRKAFGMKKEEWKLMAMKAVRYVSRHTRQEVGSVESLVQTLVNFCSVKK